MILTPEELGLIRQQAEREYPSESCGVVVARKSERRLVPCRNVQDEKHREDPAAFPRDSRTAYYIDPGDLLRIGRLEQDGFLVSVIYHSHIDAGAYFSETDKRQALFGGEPTYPNATYVVTSVLEGRATDTAAFRWNPGAKDFLPVDMAFDGAGRVERR